uniref:Nuclear pore complex protein Nup98-Nup96 n=1 Tax=Hemiscolopendra marginata TaxID=943146 RepID=A0A646QCP4_9MYRI
MFGNKSTFGSGTSFSSSSFGAGSPFGQNTSAFGGNKTLGSGFGTPSFGSAPPNNTIFNTSGTSGGSIFGPGTTNFGQPSTSSSGFGFPSSSGSGTGLFGTNTQQNAGSSLFQSHSTSAFGAPKLNFGGFGGNTSTGLFGQTQQASTPFGQTSNATSGLFGSSTGSSFTSAFATSSAGTSGTAVKFNPVTGTDTMLKNGVTTNINIRHQCITVMKEYESKSLEELRMEDYLANRKGPQQSTIGTFGTTNQNSLFNSNTSTGSTGLFQNKTLFGSAFGSNTTTPTVFGQPNQQQSTGLFGQKSISFGTTTTTTTPFTFGTNTTPNLFGSGNNTTKSLFGSNTNPTSTPGLFGTTNTLQQNTGFGAPAFSTGFGQQNQTSGLFGSKSAFGATTTTAPSFGFGATANTNTGAPLFSNKTNAGFGSAPFGNTSTGFGVFGSNANTGTNLFNQNKTATSFGGTTGFGSNLNTFGTSGGSLFGSSANKTGSSSLGLNFGANPGSTLGAALNLPPNTSILGSDQSIAQLAQQQTQAQQQLLALAQSPFGDCPLFRSVLESSGKREEVLKPTNPAAQKALAANGQFKVSPHPTAKMKPKPIHSVVNGKVSLFEGLDEDEALDSTDAFIPRRSIKKLVLKPRTDQQANTSKNNGTENDGSLVISSPSVLTAKKNISPLTLQVTRNLNDIPADDEVNHSTPTEDNHTPELVIGKYYTNPIMKPVAEHPLRNQVELNNTIAQLNVNKCTGENDDSEKENISQDASYDGSQENDSEPELVEGERQPHPAEVVLNRPGYYTIPSLDELAQLVDKNGNCIVENFTIGREGFGNIYFFGLTNVFGLNLDEIVHFRKKEVTVYPDDENKPPLGEGLNKKAQITLDGIWPADKTICKPIKSPDRLKTIRYQEKLERISARIGAKFIDYRPETGSWVFQVSHFSKYGLEESDEDDEIAGTNIQDLKKLKILSGQSLQQPHLKTDQLTNVTNSTGPLPEPTQTSPLNTQPYINGLDNEMPGYPVHDDDDDEMEDITQQSHPFDESVEDSDHVISHSSHQLALALGVSSQRMQVMKASLFAEADEISDSLDEKKRIQMTGKSMDIMPPVAPQQFTKSDRPMITHFMSDTSFGPVRKDDHMLYSQKISSGLPSLHSKPAPSPIPQNLSKYILLPSGAVSPPVRRRVPSGRIRKLLPLHQSVLNNKQNLLADTSCYMSRRFRVGWGPNWTFTHCCASTTKIHTEAESKLKEPTSPLSPDYLTSNRQFEPNPFNVVIQKIRHESFEDTNVASTNKLEENLEVMLNNSRGIMEEGCPIFVPLMGVNVFHQQAELTGRLLQETTLTPSEYIYQQYWQQVWNLCVALWGRIPDLDLDQDKENTHANRMARRKAFSEWLQSVSSEKISKEIEEDGGQDHLNAIFSHLSGYQISAACQLAQKAGDHGLALLLAQATENVECREMVQKQLQNWEEIKADCFISFNRMKLYALLAGCLVWNASEELISTCDMIDWKRSLGLHLWYSCTPTASIAEALAEYRNAFKGKTPFGKYCEPPLSPYLEKKPSLATEINTEVNRFSVYDTCYHLLVLYVKRSHRLERLLCPSTSTDDHLDHRLSWLLYQSLRGLGYQHLSEYQTNLLHLNFAAQLEAEGLWHWAVFVAMHIIKPEKRYTVVQELLNRHITLSEEEEKEKFLCDKLLVPSEWISKAKALKAHHENNYTQEAWHLLKAGKWNQSHEIILKQIASDAIINENFDFLKSYLMELSSPERNSSVLDWSIGGQVFLDYIHVSETLKKIVKGELNTYELEKLQPEVSSLCNRVGSIHCYNAKDRLCQSEMAKKTANLLRIVLTLQNPDSEPPPTYVLAPHLQHLPMPEDYALQELRFLTQDYLIEMTS